jgi:hypothetical protein
LVELEDVDRSAMWDCKNIVGTWSLHSVASISHRDVEFEITCMFLQPWKLHTLEPINITQVNIHLFLFDKALTLQIILINYYCFLISTFFEFWIWLSCRFKTLCRTWKNLILNHKDLTWMKILRMK